EAKADRVRKGLPEPVPAAAATKPLTVGELADKFLAEYNRPKIKDIETYRRDARWVLGRYIRPALGTKNAHQVTRKDIEQLRESITASGKSPQTCVHVLKCLSRMYRWA